MPAARRVGIVSVDPQEISSASGLLPVPAPAKVRLGDLSMQYETGYGPGKEAKAVARVSTGKHDRGGVSYGAYQLASEKGQPQKFLLREGAPWSGRFNDLNPAERGGAFEKIWKAVAAEDPRAFFDAQHAYIQRTHYDPVVANVRKRTGVDINRLPQAIRDAAWSAAVNHSGDGATIILSDGINNAKRLAAPSSPDFNIAALDLIYDRRTGYVKKNVAGKDGLRGLLNRYPLERKRARGMLNE
jgi:type VI secretion system secreted protein VgrG